MNAQKNVTDTCPSCDHDLCSRGEQPNVFKATMAQTGYCANPDCENYQSDFVLSERHMTMIELCLYAEAKRRLGIM